ncbi:MAG: monovalent cation/H(+) antiporter subunit G [Anaerolineales bacterium]|nr:monovalent cation/H(+) antiporter subunit G [Anaerolineales bacterium]MCW5855825.1 monovalent cation/H(+) antiporter subunit G [Anaerolineales bacterium]
MTTLEAITIILATIGVLIMLISSYGVLRFPDVFMRMHAFSKAGTLGISCLILAAAVYYPEYLARMIVLVVLFFLTGPIATTAIARAALRASTPEDHLHLTINEMQDDGMIKKPRKRKKTG